MPELKQVIADINKKYGEGTLIQGKDYKHPEVQRVASGSLFLDKCLGMDTDGVSGWPLGRVVELYGPQMSGKSTIALKTIAEAQKKKMLCAYIDVEKSFDKERAQVLGVNTDQLLLSDETMGERVIELCCDLLRSKNVSIIVIDSLAGLVPKAELEVSMEDSNRMALVASMMSQGLRKLTSLNENTLIIFINQLRTNPGAKYGNPEYTPGGKALQYYASMRVEVRAGDWIVDEKKNRIGHVTKFKITKNKTALPYQSGYYKLLYEKGEIDKIDELISMGELTSVIKRRGPYYYLGDEEQGYKGKEELYVALTKDPAIFEKARGLVFGSTESMGGTE